MTFFSTATKKAARLTLGMALATGIGAAAATSAMAQDITLRGASMFDENHAFTKTMVKFAELVEENYDGDVTFDLRLNGELGVEKDYVNFLQQGVAIDYTIMAPSNMAKFAPAIPLMDMLAIVVRRYKNGKSPFKPDRDHLHHILQRAGLSSSQTLVAISSVAAAMSCLLYTSPSPRD